MKKKAYIFDFDYTLADSSSGVVNCIEYAFSRMGLNAVTSDEACKTIGLTLEETFTRLTGDKDNCKAREFKQLFIEHAHEIMIDQTYFFKPVPVVLNKLRQRGVLLGIVSTKFRYRIESILERDKLEELFAVVIGGEDVDNHKPDPEGLIKAMSALKVSSEQCFYIGDSIIDAETAMRAQVDFIAVLSGVTKKEDFKEAKTCKIVHNLCELLIN